MPKETASREVPLEITRRVIYRCVLEPAGAAAAAVLTDMEAALGPAGEVGDVVSDGMARLMLIPAGVAAPVAEGVTRGDSTLAK